MTLQPRSAQQPSTTSSPIRFDTDSTHPHRHTTDPNELTSGGPPRRYHRQFAAQPGNRWYKPIFVVLLTAVFYGVAITAHFAGYSVWGLISLGADSDSNAWFDRVNDFNTVTGVIVGLITVALMWPAAELATFCVYRRWCFSMISLGRGMRWSLLGRYLLFSTAVWVVSAIVLVVFSTASVGDVTSEFGWNRKVLGMLIALILLVPFQATAEEIVFRGVAMNVVGAWLRHPAWAVLVPVPLFVFGHLYDLPGLIDVGIFAVIVGTLTIITGGLEAGIAFHIINNLFAFGLGALSGSDLNATSAPTVQVVISIAAPIIFAVIVILDHRRRGGASSRRGGPSSREALRPRGDASEDAETRA